MRTAASLRAVGQDVRLRPGVQPAPAPLLPAGVGAGSRGVGAGTVVGPHVVINGPTVIGKNNRIFQFASVGEDCQDKKYKGEPTRLEIGDNNVIREHCSIHRGTVQDQSLTRIGDNNLLMATVVIAELVRVGSQLYYYRRGY